MIGGREGKESPVVTVGAFCPSLYVVIALITVFDADRAVLTMSVYATLYSASIPTCGVTPCSNAAILFLG
jgi:hypothetical protein